MYYSVLASYDALNILGNFYAKIVKADLDKDEYIPVKLVSPLWERADKSYSFSAFCKWLVDKEFIHPLDKEKFLNFVDLDNLKSLLNGGKKVVHLMYRRRMTGDDYRLVSLDVFTADSYSSNHKQVILAVRDVEDLLSGYYNEPVQNVPYDIVSGCLMSLNDVQLSHYTVGVVYLCLTNLENKKEIFGERYCDELISSRAYYLKQIFIPEYCFRVGYNEFVLVVPYVSKEEFMDMVYNFHTKCKELEITDYKLSTAYSKEHGTSDVFKLAEIAKNG